MEPVVVHVTEVHGLSALIVATFRRVGAMLQTQWRNVTWHLFPALKNGYGSQKRLFVAGPVN